MDILDDVSKRYCEIYVIKNKVNGKEYVGQAVSHILNHKRYRPYGSTGRFKCHISEAFSNKKKQCRLLNNAIRKYGSDNFTVDVLDTCETDCADILETQFISKRKTLYPTGYNLTYGGTQFNHTDDSKSRVSKGLCTYYEPYKMKRFEHILQISDDVDQYIRPLNKYGEQYGWYVYIEKIKADFGGKHIPLEESKQKAINFILLLKENLAKHLDAGNPLEPSTTTS